MTVRDLIAFLKTWDQDLEVDAEGCDCINPVVGVDVYESLKKDTRLLLQVHP